MTEVAYTIVKANTEAVAAHRTPLLGAWDGHCCDLGLDGNIDDVEGTVYCFTPKGTVHRNIDPAEMVQTVEV